MRVIQGLIGLGVIAALTWLLMPDLVASAFSSGVDRRAPAAQHTALALMSEYSDAKRRAKHDAARQAEVDKVFAPRWSAVIPDNRLVDWRGRLTLVSLNEPRFVGDVKSVRLEIDIGNDVVLELYRGVVTRPTDRDGLSPDDIALFDTAAKIRKGDRLVITAEIDRIGMRYIISKSAVVRPAE